MFGLNDNSQQSNDDPAMLDNVKQLASEPADQVAPQATASDPIAPDDNSAPTAPATSAFDTPVTAATPTPVVAPAPEPLHGFSMDAPSADTPPAESPVDESTSPVADSPSPSVGSVSAPAVSSDTSDDTSGPVMPPSDPTPAPPAEEPAASLPQIDPEHLAGLKQQALEHLEPLTEHLDGTPEEQFKTTMMMIQANDNHTLLEKALETAKKIEDDKIRAQAMLDIINEINYFSQNDQQ